MHYQKGLPYCWVHTSTVFVASNLIFPVHWSWWVILLLPCWQDFFQIVLLDCNPSHFASQVCFCIFAVSSLPACGRISLFLHRIVDNINCFISVGCLCFARTVWRLGSYWAPSNWKMYASISWTQRWIFPPHKRSYYLVSCYASSSCFFGAMYSIALFVD